MNNKTFCFLAHLFKEMENRDFLFLLVTRLDNQSLEVLSHTSLWSQISQFAGTQYFWYLRSQHLVGRELRSRDVDWKRIYYILLAREQWIVNSFRGVFPVEALLSYLPALEIFLELGDDPSANKNSLLVLAHMMELEDVVKFLLSDPRVNPTGDNNLALSNALLSNNLMSFK